MGVVGLGVASVVALHCCIALFDLYCLFGTCEIMLFG